MGGARQQPAVCRWVDGTWGGTPHPLLGPELQVHPSKAGTATSAARSMQVGATRHAPSPGSSVCAMALLMQSASCPSPSSSSLQYLSISLAHWPAVRGCMRACGSGLAGGALAGVQARACTPPAPPPPPPGPPAQPTATTHPHHHHACCTQCARKHPPTLIIDVVPKLDLRGRREGHLLVLVRGLLGALPLGQALLGGAPPAAGLNIPPARGGRGPLRLRVLVIVFVRVVVPARGGGGGAAVWRACTSTPSRSAGPSTPPQWHPPTAAPLTRIRGAPPRM